MNRKQFLDKISSNWLPLVICFVAACFIYIFHEMATLEKKTLTVPLIVKNDGSMISAGIEKYRFVKVTVRGKNEQIASITEKDLTAYIDITSQTKAGKFEFPVIVEPAERLLLMSPLEITNKPELVPLTIEEKVSKFVRVVPSVAGNPAHGFKQIKAVVNPQFAGITGPKSMVESIEFVSTNMVNIENATQDINRTVSLINSNLLIAMDKKSDYAVTVSIVPEGMVRNISGVQATYENLLDDIEIVSDPLKIDLTLEGEVLTLERLDLNSIKVTVNCQDVTDEGEYVLPVNVRVPQGVILAVQSAENVQIKAIKKVFEEDSEDDELEADTSDAEPEESF